jgi:hypothetical protein
MWSDSSESELMKFRALVGKLNFHEEFNNKARAVANKLNLARMINELYIGL